MQATERPADVTAAFPVHSALSPEALFDLLADPQGCATWHVHPRWSEVDRVDAPPGPALKGTEFVTKGRMRGVPYTMTTKVTASDRPRLYAMEAEQIIEHPRALLARQIHTERFTIEPTASGSTVLFETNIWRLWNKGLLAGLSRTLQRVMDRSAQGQIHDAITLLIASADRHATVIA